MAEPSLQDCWTLAIADLDRAEITRMTCAEIFRQEMDREIAVRKRTVEIINWMINKKGGKYEPRTGT